MWYLWKGEHYNKYNKSRQYSILNLFWNYKGIEKLKNMVYHDKEDNPTMTTLLAMHIY